MAPKVFLSHSAKEPFARALLDELSVALGAAGWEVLVDRERLRGGEDWRADIDDWIVRCDAAVALLSRAALDSRWVDRELTNLGFVRRLFPALTLLPVLVGDVTADEVRNKWEPVGLADTTQFVVDIPHEELPVRVVGQLVPALERHAASGPHRALEIALVAKLKEIDDDALEYAGAAIEVDLKRWEVRERKQRLLARKLLESDLAAQSSVAWRLANVDDRVARTVYELVAPFGWIDAAAAECLLDVVNEPGRVFAVSINSEQKLTPKMYVKRVGHRWHAESIRPPESDDPLADLLDGARDILRLELAATGTESDEELDESLAFTRGLGNQLFVIVPSPIPPSEVVAGLREAFPHLLWFFLAGDERYEDFLDRGLEDVEYLRPELDSGREAQALWQYRVALAQLAPNAGERS